MMPLKSLGHSSYASRLLRFKCHFARFTTCLALNVINFSYIVIEMLTSIRVWLTVGDLDHENHAPHPLSQHKILSFAKPKLTKDIEDRRPPFGLAEETTDEQSNEGSRQFP